MFNRRSIDLKTISVPFPCTHSKILCVAVVTSWTEWYCDAIGNLDNVWGECIVWIGSDIYAWHVSFDSGVVLSYFLNYVTCHVIKNGCPCTVEALKVVSWLRPCICLRLVQGLHQGTTLLASSLHNARQPFLIHLIMPCETPCINYLMPYSQIICMPRAFQLQMLMSIAGPLIAILSVDLLSPVGICNVGDQYHVNYICSRCSSLSTMPCNN